MGSSGAKKGGQFSAEIHICNCKSDYQDMKYGKGIRVMNVRTSKAGGRLKCTVCGNKY